jgi:PAS domain-containing protein
MQLPHLSAAVLDALPFPRFVVDNDVKLLAVNRAAEALVGPADAILRKRGGEALHCIHSTESPDGCGHAPACADCVVRNSVTAAFAGTDSTHQRAKLELRTPEGTRDVQVLVTSSRFEADGKTYAVLVIEDLTELVASSSILPICMHCRRVREHDKWQPIESFLNEHMELRVSHGICPVCLETHYSEYQISRKA